MGESVALNMGDDIPRGSCWMSNLTQIQIQRQVGGKTQACMKVMTVRVLAFLSDPTDANWGKLCARDADTVGSRPIDTPFSHACGNGAAMTPGSTNGCINGLDRGGFASRAENEDVKSCRNGARALCPGHGATRTKCIYVHKTGLPKPCRMVADCVPRCSHPIPCFP